MAIDISLALIASQSNHTLPAAKEGSRWKLGQIADVIKTTTFATLDVNDDYRINEGIGSTKLVYVHITGVPGSVAKTIRNKLANTIEGNDEIDHRSIFRLKPADLPTASKNKLIAEREITVTWTQAKPYIKHSVTQTVIVDGDIT